MKRVIAAKQKTNLSNHDYYQFDKYQKVTMAINNISQEDMEGEYSKNAVAERPSRDVRLQQQDDFADFCRRNRYATHLPQKSERPKTS